MLQPFLRICTQKKGGATRKNPLVHVISTSFSNFRVSLFEAKLLVLNQLSAPRLGIWCAGKGWACPLSRAVGRILYTRTVPPTGVLGQNLGSNEHQLNCEGQVP
jgi:hypothetical protein